MITIFIFKAKFLASIAQKAYGEGEKSLQEASKTKYRLAKPKPRAFIEMSPKLSLSYCNYTLPTVEPECLILPLEGRIVSAHGNGRLGMGFPKQFP